MKLEAISFDNSRTIEKSVQGNISPDLGIQILAEGNKRFVANNMLGRDAAGQIKDTSTGQYPFAAVVSCIDSRIPTEVVFDQGIGDIFNARVAGNIINVDILGSLEFACKLAGSRLIVVLGHTSCGAVKGACDHAELGNLTAMLAKITPAVDAINTPEGAERSSKNITFVNEVAVKNVHNSIAAILADSPVLKEMKDAGTIDIVGAMYDINNGQVTFL